MKKLKENYQLSSNFDLAHYDAYMKKAPLGHRIILDFIIEKYKSDKKVKILELGAGTGRFTKFLLRSLPHIDLTLIEPDKKCCLKLKEIKKKHKKIKIIQSTAEEVKTSKTFDILIMATAFHHIDFRNKHKFLKKIKTILRKKGTFMCTDNFLDEYKTINGRKIVLKKSMDKWIRDAKNEKNSEELKMAIEMKRLVFRKDFGGEYFICPSAFETYLKKASLKIVGKVNTTNTHPLDLENYFYLIKP